MARLLILTLLAGLAAPALAAEPTTPETRDCLQNRSIRAKRLSAEQGYFVQTSQGWWRNTAGGCPAYGPRRAISTNSTADRQCKGDVVQVFDAQTRIGYGGCPLGAWEKLAAAPDVPAK